MSTLRLATGTDWPGILAVERAAFGDTAHTVYFVRMMPALFARTCWVADADGAVTGYALGAREDLDPTVGWILAVAVLTPGQGLGTALAARCVASLETLGVQRVRLTVEPGNEAAIRVYRKLGFAEVGLRPAFYGPGGDRILMERRSVHVP